jgi:signal transduction histidine kinase
MTAQALTRETLGKLCDSLSDVIIGIDRNQQICLFNPAAETALALETSSVLGGRLADHAAIQPLATLFERSGENGEVEPDESVLLAGVVYHARLVSMPGDVQIAVLSQDSVAEDTKTQLISMLGEVVHDLKNMISAAKSTLDMVGELGTLNTHQMDFAGRAQNKLESMLEVTHDLLDVTWLESGGQLNLKQLELDPLVQHTVTGCEAGARRHGVEISVDLPSEGCVVQGDEWRLGTAITNLINNAIKYSPNGGPVQVSAVAEGEEAVVRVADNGIGIAPEHIPHLFERFYRVKTAETQRIEGSGLGLSIVKAIIEKHGGRVFVESTPGKGSIFGFSLPRL